MMIVFVIVVLTMTCVAGCTGLRGTAETAVQAGLANKIEDLDVRLGDLSRAVTKIYHGDPWYQDLGQQAIYTVLIFGILYVGFYGVKRGYHRFRRPTKGAKR